MKSFDIRLAIALSTIVFALNAYAGDDSKKEIVPTEPPVPSRWSLSGGPAVSSIKATFQADPAVITLLDPSTMIYNGGATQVYDNGVVGLGGPNNPFPGFTGFSGGMRTILTSDFSTETFHGETFAPPGSVSDTETSLGAYIKLAYDAFDFDSNTLHLSPFAQYTFTTAFDTGIVPLPETVTNTTYFTSTTGVLGHFLRYTPSTFRGVSYPFQVTTPQFTADAVNSSVNIYMHTFTLGLDLTKDLTDRVHLVFTTGPTLNFFETGLTSLVIGAPAGPLSVRSDDSKVRFGWVGQLGVQVDLDSAKRWFIEASGNYHWVTPFTVATPISSARIDASSWGAELGLGWRF